MDIRTGADYFPLFINVREKAALVIGGGEVAARRVKTLLLFSCRIVVIAENPGPELCALAAARPQTIKVFRRRWAAGDCEGCLVVAATGERDVNRQIGEECGRKGIPVSVADRKEESTFFFPAVIEADDIIIGLSSDGKAPRQTKAAAAKIRALLNGDLHEKTSGITQRRLP
jgi:siroheme synthase-like protein